MSSTTRRSIRTAAALAALTATLGVTAATAGATTRDYLGLPVEQLPNVEQFDVDGSHVRMDVTVPATAPDGSHWELHTSAFAAGMFHDQGAVQELLTAGARIVVTYDVATGCAQIDLVLVGPANPNREIYAADLTDAEMCQPGAASDMPVTQTPVGQDFPPPVLATPGTPAPEADATPPPLAEAGTPAPVEQDETPAETMPADIPAAEVVADTPAPVDLVVDTATLEVVDIAPVGTAVAPPTAVVVRASSAALPTTGAHDNARTAGFGALLMAVGLGLVKRERLIRLIRGN